MIDKSKWFWHNERHHTLQKQWKKSAFLSCHIWYKGNIRKRKSVCGLDCCGPKQDHRERERTRSNGSKRNYYFYIILIINFSSTACDCEHPMPQFPFIVTRETQNATQQSKTKTEQNKGRRGVMLSHMSIRMCNLLSFFVSVSVKWATERQNYKVKI